MTGGRQRSIAKVRTFGEDVSRARGGEERERVAPKAEPQVPVPPPTALVSPTPEPVPLVPTGAPPVPPPAATRAAVESDPPPLDSQVSALPELSAAVVAPSSPLATVNATGLPDLSAADGDLTEGTIISDKKRARFKLFPAIGEAVGGWVGDAKENLTAKPDEPAVRKVETRLETLKAAAKVSSLVPQDDHGIVVKRITEVARAPVVPTANIKAATAVPPPQWKHTATPTGAANQSAPKEASGPIEPAPRRVSLTVHEVPAVAPEPPPVPAPVRATPTPAVPRSEPPRTAAVPVPQPVLPPNPEERPTPSSARTFRAAEPQRRSWRAPLTVLAVVLGTSLLGGGVGILWYTSQSGPTVSETAATPSLVTGASVVSVPLGDTRESLLTTLLGDTLRATTLTTFTFFVTDTPAPLAAQLQALSWRAPGNFLRSIRDLAIGTTGTSQPFIAIKGTDFNTGFAGMLAWEPALSSDLAPLFGTPVTESFDSAARTDTQLRAAFFRDDIVGNVSVRVLVDETNTERIIYGFIAPNLILITTTRDAFELLQPSIVP